MLVIRTINLHTEIVTYYCGDGVWSEGHVDAERFNPHEAYKSVMRIGLAGTNCVAVPEPRELGA